MNRIRRTSKKWMWIWSGLLTLCSFAVADDAATKRTEMLQKNAAESIVPEIINPFATRKLIAEKSLWMLTFDENAGTSSPGSWKAWNPLHNAEISGHENLIRLTGTDADPYVAVPVQVNLPDETELGSDQLVMRLRVRGNCRRLQVFPSTTQTPGYYEETSFTFTIPGRDASQEDKWSEVDATIPNVIGENLNALRFDPGADRGDFCELMSIEILQCTYNPLEITRLVETKDGMKIAIRNHGKVDLQVPIQVTWMENSPQSVFANVDNSTLIKYSPSSSNVIPQHIVAGETREWNIPLNDEQKNGISYFGVTADPTGSRCTSRATYRLQNVSPADATWMKEIAGVQCYAYETRLESNDNTNDVSSYVTQITLVQDGQTMAIIGPIAWKTAQTGERTTPAFRQDLSVDDANVLKLRSLDHDLTFTIMADKKVQTDGSQNLRMTLESASNTPFEGPVIRTQGTWVGGILAGVEYLGSGAGAGKGDQSSSKFDCITDERFRFQPDSLKVAYPYMMQKTSRGTVAVVWENLKQVQPVYATPNFYEESETSPDYRMACSTQNGFVSMAIRLSNDSIEDSILWGVDALGGLPPLPKSPRSRDESDSLYLQALTHGPLRGPTGWGHCIGSSWTQNPAADHASTVWRLSGEKITFPNCPTGYTLGGAHLRNEAIFFVTGHANDWLKMQYSRIQNLIDTQKSDGSYTFDGIYTTGHFENTALGICALPAMSLLEYAYQTGDQNALDAGLKTLDYMKRFDVPRGAQCWEIPLHSPDQLAAAYAVKAYVRGYELTGRDEYLAEARRWAITGIPFTYLWSDADCPVMPYSTTPVFGATFWTRPMWVGLPVQWVGGVYASALVHLAPYDDSFDWKKLARGILITAEQMIYPEGPSAGTLPDSFTLSTQRRNPADINPCAIVSLQRQLDGLPDTLYTIVAPDGDRITAPYPIRFEADKMVIETPEGESCEYLYNGEVRSYP